MGASPPVPGLAPVRRPGRRLIIAGAVLMGMAVVVGLGLTALAFLPLVAGDRPVPLDGRLALDLQAGDERVFYRLEGLQTNPECSATGPDGRPVQVSPEVFPSTLTLDGVSYSASSSFTAVVDGRHEVRCGEAPGRVAVGERISVLRTVFLGFGGIFGGIATFMVGIVVLVVGLVVRSSGTSRGQGPPPYPGPPPYSGQPPYPGAPPYPGPPPGQAPWG